MSEIETLNAFVDTDDEGNRMVRIDYYPQVIVIDIAMLRDVPRYIVQNFDGTFTVSPDVGGEQSYKILGVDGQYTLRCEKTP